MATNDPVQLRTERRQDVARRARRESLADERTPGGFSGILSGPIARALGAGGREQRADAAASEAQGQFDIDTAAAQQSGQTLFGQFGFSEEQQQDPRVQAVERGLDNPNIRAQTLLQAEDLQAEFGINQDLLSTFNLDRSRQLAPGQRALQDQAIIAGELGIEKARIDLQKSVFDRANPNQRLIDLTKPQAVFSPFVNTGVVAFLPGTVEHTKEQTKLNSLQFLLKDVSDAMVDIDTFGSERWNDEAVGRMRSRQAGLLIRLNTAREAGVPSGPELELAARSLPDVNDFSAQFGVGRKDRWLEAYRQVERELTRSIMGEMAINPMLHLDYSLLNPADVSPELQEFYQANAPTMQSIFSR